jgi:hypothetical protein
MPKKDRRFRVTKKGDQIELKIEKLNRLLSYGEAQRAAVMFSKFHKMHEKEPLPIATGFDRGGELLGVHRKNDGSFELTFDGTISTGWIGRELADLGGELRSAADAIGPGK